MVCSLLVLVKSIIMARPYKLLEWHLIVIPLMNTFYLFFLNKVMFDLIRQPSLAKHKAGIDLDHRPIKSCFVLIHTFGHY